MDTKPRLKQLTPTISAVLLGETFLGIVEKGQVYYGEQEWLAFSHRSMEGPVKSKRRDAVEHLVLSLKH